MADQMCIAVTALHQIGEVRRAAARMALTIALPDARRGDATLVATELATNLARHARNGEVWLQTLSSGPTACLEIVAVDSGPGIADCDAWGLNGHPSTDVTGGGIVAVRRLADEFDAFSVVGRGTAVVARLSGTPALSRSFHSVSAFSLPAPGETVSGDAWRVVERDKSIAIMVADGLGHGPHAASASGIAANVFLEHPFVEASVFYTRAHTALLGSRGAAVAHAVVQPEGRVTYASVGNIAGSLVGMNGSRGLVGQNGTVGAQMRRQVRAEQYDWPGGGVLLMYSDGIMGRLSFDSYAGLVERHPALIAATLFRDFRRGGDDATLVVIRRANGAQTE
jgi:anti-sigma regulatory factor (Ser/Thr protein kinase)